MTFKEKLKEIRKIIFEEKENITIEVREEIEIPREKIYSIRYLYFNDYRVREIRDITLFNFMLPEGLNEEDAFKIISYCFDHTGHDFGSYECCTTAISLLKTLKLQPIQLDINEQKFGRINLFSVVNLDDGTMFKNSPYYKEYIDWYKPNVSHEEFSKICDNYSLKKDKRKELI